jgi:hypothetical protein
MYVVNRARVLSVATLAWLAMTAAAWSAQPSSGPLFQSSSLELVTDASAELPQPAAPRSSRLLKPPEPLATPPIAENDALGGDSPTWEDDEDPEGDPMDAWSNGRFGRGLWYAGLDYLLVRPRLSQGIGEIRTTQITDNTTVPATSTFAAQTVQFPFKYQSSFRATLGYRLLDCGGDLSVTYWRLSGSARVHDGPSNVTNGGAILAGVLEVNTQADNQFLTATTGVTANIFDVDFAKCMSMGGPQNPCDCCFCPRWDLRWTAGARVADVNRFNNVAVTQANGDLFNSGNVNARFVGAGPRVGLQGRRYFGRTGLMSVYAKANMALLIGDYRMNRLRTLPGNAQAPTEIDTQNDTFARIIPVADIEVGGSWQVAPYTFISAGWFFQAWWDLGQAETVNNTPTFDALSSANILGFDGLFVRGEILF